MRIRAPPHTGRILRILRAARQLTPSLPDFFTEFTHSQATSRSLDLLHSTHPKVAKLR